MGFRTNIKNLEVNTTYTKEIIYEESYPLLYTGSFILKYK